MADLYEYLNPQGVILPDTADVQAQVEQEFRDALGQNLIVTPNTPQGVLIAAEVTARMAVLRANAQLANQINPNLAGGVFLDALWALTGGSRRTATKTVVQAVALTGAPGTLIPAGTLAATGAGDQFASLADVTLGAGGTASVDFAAVEYGPVPCASGALSVLVSAVLGWETVTNPAAGLVGLAGESDAAARLRRRNTLALQGVALPEAVTSALYDVEGVRSLTFRENKGLTSATIDGILIGQHSIWVCVDGGADADIGATLLAKTSLGCLYTGDVDVTVIDPVTGQDYLVRFNRPTPVPVLTRFYVKTAGVVGDPLALVQEAVLAYAAGEMDGERGFVVGGAVSPFELAGAVSRQVPGMYVQKVEVTKAAVVNYQPTEVALALNQIATIDGSGIQVNIV
jgi:hypothetical protein